MDYAEQLSWLNFALEFCYMLRVPPFVSFHPSVAVHPSMSSRSFTPLCPSTTCSLSEQLRGLGFALDVCYEPTGSRTSGKPGVPLSLLSYRASLLGLTYCIFLILPLMQWPTELANTISPLFLDTQRNLLNLL